MKTRTQVRAGRLAANHSEALQVRTALKAGKIAINHNEVLQVRSALKAGKIALNHNEALQVRSAVKAGRIALNHNESLCPGQSTAIAMRRQPLTTARKDDRLELLVVRAGLRAGLRRYRARK